ncbi:MAG TPA: hypothetical protein DCE42_02665 [Myxococcales bacterium]|nr:hypothetical protein [Deltaproteobacteria bacterium]MBU53824.1 hypothetical protein [Deltaproteobacteria bacterium]HAA53628.1 hypothetical protein [Myxococcales bacterium]|tara:strand:+ start:4279 stop:5511 length:1233 start_codon:yes stop_codon:yes gene_type:complete
MRKNETTNRSRAKLIVCISVIGALLSLWMVEGCSPGVRPGQEKTITENTNNTDGGVTDKTTTNPDTTTTPDKTTTPDNPPVKEEPPKEPKPEELCSTLFTCIQRDCKAPATRDCITTCGNTLQGTGKTHWQALDTCLTTNCASCTDGQCLQNCTAANCAKEWLTCAANDGNGQETCEQMSQCVDQCPSGAEGCKASCIQKGNAAAHTEYQAILTCQGQTKQGNGGDAEYIACYEKTLACACPNDKPGTGQKVCKDYIGCIGACTDTDSCCIAKCRAELVAADVAKADKFTTCVVKNCEGQCQPNDKACSDQCVLQNCNDDLVACSCPGVGQPGTGSGKCGAGLQCVDKCGDDICCIATCTANMSSSSYKKFEEVSKCLPKCGCQNNDKSCFETCLTQGKCSSEALKCTLG